MNNLYFIGGAEKCGKTTIFKKIIKKEPVVSIQTDAVRDCIEKVLIDDMEIISPIDDISFSGDVVFQHSINDSRKENIVKHFSKKISGRELVWDAVIGMIKYYENKSTDVIIEGIEVTPERVNNLTLKNFSIKSVFLGYTENTNFEETVNRFKKEGFSVDNKHFLKKKFDEHVKKGKMIEGESNKYGYKFFSFDNNNFEKYCDKVLDYLLEE